MAGFRNNVEGGVDLGGEYGGSASIFWRTKKYKKKDGEFYGRNNTKHSNQGKYCFFFNCGMGCISSVTVFD